MRVSVWNLVPKAYEPHMLHAESRAWVEKNCYVDIWIELLHAHRLDPMAMLAFTVRHDFLDDQWVFFKPPHSDIEELYGIDVQELNVWRPLVMHAIEQLAHGNLILTEADAHFLPDTRGTDYRQNHVKTTIVLETIDTDAHTLGYFHNGSYHELGGDDFDGALGVTAAQRPAFLPLFAEVARMKHVKRSTPNELGDRSLTLLRRHLARRPTDNPFVRFKNRFIGDVAALASEGLAAYHVYAFATLRQCGANFELTSLYLKWLDHLLGQRGEPRGDELERASNCFDDISQTAKALILKGARAVTTKKAPDFSSMLGSMEAKWAEAMSLVDTAVGATNGLRA
ncbi:MAG: DUF1839 family protein [Polyangiaceae bacterium]